MPKPYLAIKETLVREYARRGGQLRRREARNLVKIDVNKTARIWEFLHQAGFLQSALDERGTERDRNDVNFGGMGLSNNGVGNGTVPPSNAETP